MAAKETQMATTMEIGNGLVALVKEGKYKEAVDSYYSDDIVSTEPMSPHSSDPVTAKGLAAVKEKLEWWYASMETHSMELAGPFPNGDQFVVEYKLDVTDKQSGHRFLMHEMALYTVKNGKIVDEKFFYTMG